MWVDVELIDVTLDPRDARAVVWFAHRPSQRYFPIWVEDRDVFALTGAVDEPAAGGPARDLDLFRGLADVVGAVVEGAHLTRIQGGVLQAVLMLRWGGMNVRLEARPSDALRIALSSRAPIRIHEELLERVAARIREAEARMPTEPEGVGAASVNQSPAERWNALLAHFSFESGRSPYEA